MMKSKNHDKMQSAIGHFMVLLGIYLLSAGLLEEYSLIPVLRSSIFWGIFLIITAIAHPLKGFMK